MHVTLIVIQVFEFLFLIRPLWWSVVVAFSDQLASQAICRVLFTQPVDGTVRPPYLHDGTMYFTWDLFLLNSNGTSFYGAIGKYQFPAYENNH